MKTRIISGAVGIALFAVVLWLHKTPLFPTTLALIGALMAYELARAEKLEREYVFIGASALYAAVCAFLPRTIIMSFFDFSPIMPYIVITFAYIVICQTTVLFRHNALNLGRYYICFVYMIFIGGAMLSLSQIEYSGRFGVPFLVLTFMGAWVADTGAYFAGTLFGKHKLCPGISPKKTVEGVVGGAIANAVAFVVFGMVRMRTVEYAVSSPLCYAVLGIICSLLGLLGDLSASVIKRDADIKDYGNIMPGHGGAMDRFDSIIYIAPFMLLALSMG